MFWGPGRELRGSWPGAVPNLSGMSRTSPPAPFRPLMTRAIAAGELGAAATAGVGRDEYVNAK